MNKNPLINSIIAGVIAGGLIKLALNLAFIPFALYTIPIFLSGLKYNFKYSLITSIIAVFTTSIVLMYSLSLPQTCSSIFDCENISYTVYYLIGYNLTYAIVSLMIVYFMNKKIELDNKILWFDCGATIAIISLFFIAMIVLIELYLHNSNIGNILYNLYNHQIEIKYGNLLNYFLSQNNSIILLLVFKLYILVFQIIANVRPLTLQELNIDTSDPKAIMDMTIDVTSFLILTNISLLFVCCKIAMKIANFRNQTTTVRPSLGFTSMRIPKYYILLLLLTTVISTLTTNSKWDSMAKMIFTVTTLAYLLASLGYLHQYLKDKFTINPIFIYITLTLLFLIVIPAINISFSRIVFTGSIYALVGYGIYRNLRYNRN